MEAEWRLQTSLIVRKGGLVEARWSWKTSSTVRKGRRRSFCQGHCVAPKLGIAGRFVQEGRLSELRFPFHWRVSRSC